MDSILSVRISEDIKEKFQKLAEEEGINNKEFMDLIIKNYEVNKAVTNVDFIKNDVEELQNIVKRIFDIYINMIEKNKTKTLEIKNSFSNTLEDEKIENEKLKECINGLGEDLNNLKLENKRLNESISEYKILLSNEKEDCKGIKELNVMLKDKIEALNDYKVRADELQQKNIELNENLSLLMREKEGYLNDLNNSSKIKESLENQINELKITHDQKLKDMSDNLQREITIKDNEMQLYSQKVLIQKEQEFRDEVWNLRSHYDEKISKPISDKENLLLKIADLNLKDESK